MRGRSTQSTPEGRRQVRIAENNLFENKLFPGESAEERARTNSLRYAHQRPGRARPCCVLPADHNDQPPNKRHRPDTPDERPGSREQRACELLREFERLFAEKIPQTDDANPMRRRSSVFFTTNTDTIGAATWERGWRSPHVAPPPPTPPCARRSRCKCSGQERSYTTAWPAATARPRSL